MTTFFVSVLAAAPLKAGGRLEIEEGQSIDLGEFPAWESQRAQLVLKNTGDQVVTIRRVQATCRCAKTRAEPTRVPPGRRTVIHIATIPRSLIGSFSKPLYIESDAESSPVLSVSMVGRAVPLVSVTPARYLHAGRIPLGVPWSKEFELTSAHSDVRLGGPVTKADVPIDAELKTHGDDTTRSALSVTVPARDVPGKWNAEIVIPIVSPTNHPAIEISLVGRIGYDLYAIPHELELPRADQPIRRTFSLRLAGPTQDQLKADDLLLPVIEGVEFKSEPQRGSNRVKLLTTFAPEFLAGLQGTNAIPLEIRCAGSAPAIIRCRAER